MKLMIIRFYSSVFHSFWIRALISCLISLRNKHLLVLWEFLTYILINKLITWAPNIFQLTHAIILCDSECNERIKNVNRPMQCGLVTFRHLRNIERENLGLVNEVLLTNGLTCFERLQRVRDETPVLSRKFDQGSSNGICLASSSINFLAEVVLFNL